MIEVEMRGAAELRYVAGLLRKEAAAGLRAKLARRLRLVPEPLRALIPAVARAYLPSGYGATMADAIRVHTSVRLGLDPGLRVRVTARGRVEKRDVAAVNAGRLRHPLFGDRSRWYVTAVIPEFVDEPIERMRPEFRRAAEQALADVADAIVKG